MYEKQLEHSKNQPVLLKNRSITYKIPRLNSASIPVFRCNSGFKKQPDIPYRNRNKSLIKYLVILITYAKSIKT